MGILAIRKQKAAKWLCDFGKPSLWTKLVFFLPNFHVGF
jgi:hypothetical protein